MTGLITWAIEVTSPRIERSRDTRGPSVETLQAMLTIATGPHGIRHTAITQAIDLAARKGLSIESCANSARTGLSRR